MASVPHLYYLGLFFTDCNRRRINHRLHQKRTIKTWAIFDTNVWTLDLTCYCLYHSFLTSNTVVKYSRRICGFASTSFHGLVCTWTARHSKMSITRKKNFLMWRPLNLSGPRSVQQSEHSQIRLYMALQKSNLINIKQAVQPVVGPPHYAPAPCKW